MTDISKLSTDDLIAYKEGRLKDVSTDALVILKNIPGQRINTQTTRPLQAFSLGLSDMASMGLDDELSGFGRALGAKVRGDDRSLSELTKIGIESRRAEHKAAKTDKPKTYAGGQITGAVVPAFLPGGSNIASWVGRGGLRARVAKGAATGAASVGAYGFNSAEGGAMDRLSAGARGSAMGAVIGGGIPVVGAVAGSAVKGTENAIKGIKSRKIDALEQSLETIKNQSRRLYEESDSLGAVLSPSAAQGLSSSLNGLIKNSNTTAGQSLYSRTMSAIDDINADLQAGNTGLSNLDMHRQILGNIAKDITNPNRAQEAAAAKEVIDRLDDFVSQLGPAQLSSGDVRAIDALNAARKQWSTAKKFETVMDAIVSSGGDANKLKNSLDRLANNKKKTMGFSDEEFTALKDAAQNTTGEGILKLMGRFGIDLGSARAAGSSGVGAILLSGIAAGNAGLTTGGASLVAGTAARAGQKYIARGKAENILKVIEGGGDVPLKEIMSLPPREAQKVLGAIRGLSSQIPKSLVSETQK